MNIGLLLGTFDPPHNGHLAIARHMRDHEGMDEVWLVVTPRNPLKSGQVITGDRDRLDMVRAALGSEPRLFACDEELALPAPNYTVDTLAHFRRRWPQHAFALIVGSDNLAGFDRWKDPEVILAHHRLLVYPRPGSEMDIGRAVHARHPNVHITHAPLVNISSTRIRRMVHDLQPIEGSVPPAVEGAIREKGLYKD
jgi:nicotinate-nucleotide adenylyltransferase